MTRIDAYLKMLQASSQLQRNIALILEAKAKESACSAEWLCHHVSGPQFDDGTEQLRKAIEVHEQLLEVIDGLTKMEHALFKNMQAILGGGESGDFNGPPGGEYGYSFPAEGDVG